MRSSTAKPLAWDDVVERAERREGLVRRSDLIAFGYHQRQIRRLVLNGRLLELHRDVYALGHRALSRRAQFLAAVWWAGEDAALSHESAAVFYGWIKEDAAARLSVHVTVRGNGVRSKPGVRVHRTRHLDHHDVMRYGDLRVTDRVRTLIDLADHLTYAELRAVADELPSLPKQRLIATAKRLPGRAGAGRTQRLIHSEDAHARFEMERRSVRYFAQHGVPAPGRPQRPRPRPPGRLLVRGGEARRRAGLPRPPHAPGRVRGRSPTRPRVEAAPDRHAAPRLARPRPGGSPRRRRPPRPPGAQGLTARDPDLGSPAAKPLISPVTRRR